MKAMLVNDNGMPVWSDVENPIIKDDELLEVTPVSLRLRKRILSKELRMKQQFRKK